MRLVFDLGGVVFRWRPDEFLPRLMPDRAATPEAARAFAKIFFQGFGGDWGEFDRGRLDVDGLATRIAERIDLDPAEARRLIEAIPHELQPLPDTVALLERLHASGRPLYFLSNMPLPYVEHLEATHDVFRHFERGVFSARVGLIKPEPEMFAHAAAAFGVAPADLLLIDDVVANVEAAGRTGWRGLLFVEAIRCAADIAEIEAAPAQSPAAALGGSSDQRPRERTKG